MYNEDFYRGLTTCDILKMTKTVLDGSPMYSSQFDIDNDRCHYDYFIWQTKRKIVEIMETVETPLLMITYDALVNRSVYKHYVYDSVSGYDLQPNELNEKREKKLMEAEKRMKEIPVEGYEQYAIVSFMLNCRRDEVSLQTLRGSIATTGRLGVFLWYDFRDGKKDNFMLPIITW